MTCDFCYRHCSIEAERPGACGRRRMVDGRIVDVGYGEVIAFAVDPVEKKPLYHFLPGSRTASFAMAGCNLSCKFCQNWDIAQDRSLRGRTMGPEDIVAMAKEDRCPSVSYTYSEPLVWQDFMLAVAKPARKSGLRNIMVSNGTFSAEALERILPWIDAYNIDLKGDREFYRTICHGNMEPVTEGLRRIVEYGSHVEVTTMLIEGIHDEAMVRELGTVLASCGVQVWHLSRFFPRYRMAGREATSEAFLAKMLAIAKESGVPFIYPGNSALPVETRCPSCGCLVRRHPGDAVRDGVCPSCGATIYGLW
ncbi:MAG: AmmeMemoRadiSam system radical SAM enzyme [Sphaerochaetaceae bacterium]|jgi:pyruvate formate lyase activating enzyme